MDVISYGINNIIIERYFVIYRTGHETIIMVQHTL